MNTPTISDVTTTTQAGIEVTTRTVGGELRSRYYNRGGLSAHLHVTRDTKGPDHNKRYTGRVFVSWSANRGNGWGRLYQAKFNSIAAALAFAEVKGGHIEEWFTKAVPVERSGGAAALFSASVASMRR